jgi:hypothetical protein
LSAFPRGIDEPQSTLFAAALVGADQQRLAEAAMHMLEGQNGIERRPTDGASGTFSAKSSGTELKFGIDAEGKSLESIATPLSK